MKNVWFIVLSILGLLGVSLLIRVWNITILPVFADEAIYIRWAQVMRSVPELRFLPLSDGKQPLFMWTVMPFLKVFSDPLIAGRMVSVITGIGTTIGISILTFLLFIPKTVKKTPDMVTEFIRFAGQFDKEDELKKILYVSLLAGLLYAISPFSVFFDRLALADSMLSMFGVWTFIFAILSVRYQRLDMSMFAGFTLGAALLTKSPALYFAILLPATLLFFEFRNMRLRSVFSLIGLWIVSLGIGYAIFNILRLGPNFHMLSSRNLDYVYPVSHIFERPFDPLIPFLHRVWEWLFILGPSILVLLIILGVVLNLKKYPREILFLFILSFAPIVASAEFAKVFTARYIFFSIPYLMILASLTLFTTRKLIVYVLFGIFIGNSMYANYWLLTDPRLAAIPRSERSGYLEEWTAGQGIKEISEFLKKEYQRNPNQKIVVGTEGYFGTLPDGLQIYMNDRPEVTIIGVGQPIRNVHESLLESKNAGNKTYLVVNDTRLLEDPGKLNLRLVEKYEKVIKPDGSQEFLLFFEVL